MVSYDYMLFNKFFFIYCRKYGFQWYFSVYLINILLTYLTTDQILNITAKRSIQTKR